MKSLLRKFIVAVLLAWTPVVFTGIEHAKATVSTTTNSTTALGNGVTTIFTYAFPMLSQAYAEIVYTDANGVETTLNPSQYTLVINANGGTVTYPLSGSPIASGTSLTISRIVPYIQTTSIASQGPTFRAIENALDYLTYEVQQVANGIAASFSDAFFEIFNATDNTKKIKFFAGDITTGTTSTYAFPNGSADVVTDTATQTLTNKTLTAPVITGLTQYNVLVGGGSGVDIVKIPPGAASTVLASNGAGANPSFQAFPGGGTLTSVTFGSGLTADFNPCVASCTATLATIADNTVLANTSGGAAIPTAQKASNAVLANMANGTIKGRATSGTGAPEDLTVSQVLGLLGSSSQGDIIYNNGSAFVFLTAGTNGQFLQTQGAGANPRWATPSGVRQILFSVPAPASGTSDIPDDNTTPLISEGTEIWTQAITPTTASSKILIQAAINGTIVSGNTMVLTLFRGSTLIGMVRGAPSDFIGFLSLNILDEPATASAVTYSIRVGRGTAGGTWYVSQASSAKYNGALATNGVTLIDITP